jgi:hypothetical protein
MCCNLFSLNLDGLRIFADKLGLSSDWFQEPPQASWSHYSLTHGKREEAIKAGAVLTDHFKALEVSLRQRGAWDKANQLWVEKARQKAATKAAARMEYGEL